MRDEHNLPLRLLEEIAHCIVRTAGLVGVRDRDTTTKHHEYPLNTQCASYFIPALAASKIFLVARVVFLIVVVIMRVGRCGWATAASAASHEIPEGSNTSATTTRSIKPSQD